MSDLKVPAVDEKQPTSSLDVADDTVHSASLAIIDPAVQKSAIFKIDVAVLGCFGLMYFLANLDRNNLVSRFLERIWVEVSTELNY